jgi:hypothetical protein
MNGQLFRAGAIVVTPLLIVALTAMLQWLGFAMVSIFSHTRFPKRGLRVSERNLLISSAVVVLAWIAQIDPSLLAAKSHATQAGLVASAAQGSCASISDGMSSEEVRKKVGTPDETRSEEETRGPGAQVLVYRSSRCAVHMLDDRVNSIE